MNTTKIGNGKNLKDLEEIKKTVNPVMVEKIDQLKDATNAKKLAPQKLKSKSGLIESDKTLPSTATASNVSTASLNQLKSNSNISSPSPITTTPVCTTNKTSRSESVTSSIGLTSVNDLLQFIEGSSSVKTKDPQKKAAKKAKQKQKKEDLKRVDELKLMREEFHEYFVKEVELKKEIKLLRSEKKKDKKKINEVEGKLKRCDREKAVKELAMIAIIEQIQETTPEFKFDYSYKVPQPIKATPPKVQQPAPVENPLHANYVAGMNATKKFMPILEAGLQNGANFEANTDPAKRMVTIKRVNLPHAEPQVTVTAKGPSPDKDMLLYTFVNGQLVPGMWKILNSFLSIILVLKHTFYY